MNQTIDQKQSWWQLLSIQTGGAICLPVIMAGQFICQKYGWLAALFGVGLGNLFLLIIGYFLASMSTTRPQSTIQHAERYFGSFGRVLFAFILIFSMLGWFGIQLNVIVLSCQQLLNLWGAPIPYLLLTLGIGTLISSVMCFGMCAMKWLSYFSAPLLSLTLIYSVWTATGTIQFDEPLSMSWLGSLSLIVGANIAAIIDLPTFFRHAKSGREARICIVLLYGLVVPFIEIVGVYLAAITGGDSILEVLQTGHGSLWMMWICCFVFLSGWATNNANLYSALTSSYSLFGQLRSTIPTLVLGAIGTGIACFNPLNNIEDVLDLFGITIGGLGAVILASYLLEQSRPNFRSISWISLLSWSMGVALALTPLFFRWFITGVPAFDAFLASFLTQIFFTTIYQRNEIYETIEN